MGGGNCTFNNVHICYIFNTNKYKVFTLFPQFSFIHQSNSQHFKRHFYLYCLQFSFPVTPQFLTDSLLPCHLLENVFIKVTNYFWFPILNDEHSSSASLLSFLKPLLLFCRERAN